MVAETLVMCDLDIWGQNPHSLSHCNTLHTCAVWTLNTDCCCCTLLDHVQALGKINSRDEVGVSSHSYIQKLKPQSSIHPASPTPAACPVYWPIPLPPRADAAFSHISILHPAWNFIRRPLCDCLPDGGERYFERTASGLGPWHSETRIRVSEEAV